MKKIILFVLLFIQFQSNIVKAQSSLKLQLGISYIEHFSTGIVLSLNNKQNVSFIYGSNFFVKPQSFSSYMLQYEYLLQKYTFQKYTPKIGIKGGYTIYTNDFYQWKLINLVPFIGTNYSINKRIDISCDLGITFSRELSIKRISNGEVGWYKHVLPELKIAVFYNLQNK